MARNAQRFLFVWLGIALTILLADQITKVLIIGSFQLGDSHTVTSFFNLVRVHNSGAAFSFLSSASGWQRWLFTGIGLGAAGNVIDRVLWGYVIDFLDFHWDGLAPLFYQGHFPAFNVADSAISVGTVCLILDELLRVRRAA